MNPGQAPNCGVGGKDHGNRGKLSVFICGPSGPYEYEGILLELTSHIGPHPIRRSDGDPWERVPTKVWEIVNRFAQEPDKDKFLVNPE